MKNRAFDRIFIVMLENQHEPSVRKNRYMRSLEDRGARLSQFYGVAHPSQPNYLASIAGAPLVADDGPHDIHGQTTLVDRLEEKGLSWKGYMENLPLDDKAAAVSPDGLYFRKHNPFISFDEIRENPARLGRITGADELAADVQAGTLPEYAWYSPNIENGGHSPPGVAPGDHAAEIDYLARWLEGFLTPLLAEPRFMKGTLVVVTFDESIPYADNHIYTTLLGDMVKPGTVVSERFDHYSVLRTVEESFDLAPLGTSDRTAPWFEFLWDNDPAPFDWARHGRVAPP